MFCLVKIDPQTGAFNHAPSGDTLALIATAAGSLEDGLRQTELTFQTLAGVSQAKFKSLLVPAVPAETAVLQADAPLRQRALAFGQDLAHG
jgi:hypothetical protein